jgi:hypothetical protein
MPQYSVATIMGSLKYLLLAELVCGLSILSHYKVKLRLLLYGVIAFVSAYFGSMFI